MRLTVWVLCLGVPVDSWAAFASQFSISVGEEFNDNIFFSKKKEHDFVTVITPGLHIYYAPEGQVVPTLNLNIRPSGQIFARHSELNNFGNDVALDGGYSYQYSPRLRFNLADSLARLGQTRTTGLASNGSFQSPAPIPSGGIPGVDAQNLNDFISRGDQITNSFSLQGSYLYRPDINFVGGYTNRYTRFIDQGGSDVFHTIGGRGVYNWRRDHNLHAGYSISIFNARNGDSGLVHNFDIGDDYFSNYNLQLSPTLSLAASTGISLNTGSEGPRVANNTNVTITKLWETAVLSGGVRKGLTPSFGVSGISDTTTMFTNFVMRLTEKLTMSSGANFSFFDTDDVNFKTFEGTVGLQYPFTTWLSSALIYSFRWIDSGAGANRTDLLSRGVVKSNSVFLSLTTRFDLWPNTGLARSLTASSLLPVLTTPFPNLNPSPSSVPSGKTP